MLHVAEGVLRCSHLVEDRIGHVVLHDGAHRRLESGGEQHRLALGGAHAEDPADSRQETHVGHPISLVHHDGRDGAQA